jgi:LDH2 family malate/lactate/ureidoglycolate dehydrogenase
MRIDAFRPASEFKENMDKWISRFRSARTVANQSRVKIPGDPEREIAELRTRKGIPLNEKVKTDLIELGEKLGVTF